MSVFSEITKDLTKIIEEDLFNRSADLITKVSDLFALGFGIYLIILIWGYQKAGLDDSISDLIKKIGAWLIIIALAFNAENYKLLAEAVYKAPDEVASWITGNTLGTDFVETQLLNVDEVVSEISKMNAETGTFSMGTSITLSVATGVVFFIGYLTVLFIWGFYMITKFSLALVLILGPIFIGSMLFPTTRQYGMNWIGQIFNYIVTITLYMGISLIQLNYVESTLKKFKAPTKKGWFGDVVVVDLELIWALLGNLLIITIIFIPICLSIPSIAASLTGGAGVDGHGRFMERLARGTTAGATYPLRAYWRRRKEKAKNKSGEIAGS
ncbi:hypothetical protein AAEX37_01060 [Oligella sp. MSHR50489EDL]|uniref:type IV secretion system protein n=1 Tax=Oligella sp. MSHR50489EDL TaxID=3139409 RepID=UPI003D817CF1